MSIISQLNEIKDSVAYNNKDLLSSFDKVIAYCKSFEAAEKLANEKGLTKDEALLRLIAQKRYLETLHQWKELVIAQRLLKRKLPSLQANRPDEASTSQTTIQNNTRKICQLETKVQKLKEEFRKDFSY